MRLDLSATFAIAALVWGCLAVALWPSHGQPLGWDEVDYANAARLGALSNAFERGSLTASQFIELAKAKRSGQEPNVAASYQEVKDPFLLRHFHPPLVVYLISAAYPPVGQPSDRTVRSVQLLGALAFILVILLSYRTLSDGVHWSGLLIVSLLALWMGRLLFAAVSFHGWFAVWTVASAIFLYRYLHQPATGWGIALCISLALATLTLETGILVALGVILSVAVLRSNQMSWRRALAGAGVVMILVLLAWPGSLLKASMLKIPAMYFYRLWLGKEYAAVHYRPLLAALFPVPALMLIATGFVLLRRRSELRRLAPFAIVGLCYVVVMVPFALVPEYLLPGLAVLICVIGSAIDQIPSNWTRGLVVATTIACVVTAWPRHENPSSISREDLAWLRTHLRGRITLMQGGHIAAYYLGGTYTIQPVVPTYDGGALALRKDAKYLTVTRRDIAGCMIVMLVRTREPYRRMERELLGSCEREVRRTIRVYDCRAVSLQNSAAVSG